MPVAVAIVDVWPWCVVEVSCLIHILLSVTKSLAVELDLRAYDVLEFRPVRSSQCLNTNCEKMYRELQRNAITMQRYNYSSDEGV